MAGTNDQADALAFTDDVIRFLTMIAPFMWVVFTGTVWVRAFLIRREQEAGAAFAIAVLVTLVACFVVGVWWWNSLPDSRGAR